MATRKFFPFPHKAIVSLVFLVLAITCASSARILEEEEPPAPVVAPEVSDSVGQPVSGVTPVGTAPATATGAATPDHTLSFFMHVILGGSKPSARAVIRLVVNPALSGQVSFAKLNSAVLPVNSGVPVNNANSGVINNNNIPFLTGLGGTTPNVTQNNGNNNYWRRFWVPGPE